MSIRINFLVEEGCGSSTLLCIWCWGLSPLHWGGSREGSGLQHLEVLQVCLHPGRLGVHTQLPPLPGDQAAGRKPTLGHSAAAVGCLHWLPLAAPQVSLAVPPSPSWPPSDTLGALPWLSHPDPQQCWVLTSPLAGRTCCWSCRRR